MEHCQFPSACPRGSAAQAHIQMSTSNQRPQARDVPIDVYDDRLWIRHCILLESTSVAWGAASFDQFNSALLQPPLCNVTGQTFRVYTFGIQRANFTEEHADPDENVTATLHSLCILGFDVLQKYVRGEIGRLKRCSKSSTGVLRPSAHIFPLPNIRIAPDNNPDFTFLHSC